MDNSIQPPRRSRTFWVLITVMGICLAVNVWVIISNWGLDADDLVTRLQVSKVPDGEIRAIAKAFERERVNDLFMTIITLQFVCLVVMVASKLSRKN